MNSQVRLFEQLGCIVEEAEPDFADFDAVFKTMRALEFEAKLGDLVRQHRDQFKETIQWEVDRAAKLSLADVARAEVQHAAIWMRFQNFLQSYEYFILPVTQVPPFPIDQPFITEIEGVKMDNYIDWMKSCYYISAVGNPAISVPCGFTEEGLPVGLQIVGRHRAELSVLRIAHAYEKVRGEPRKPAPPPHC